MPLYPEQVPLLNGEDFSDFQINQDNQFSDYPSEDYVDNFDAAGKAGDVSSPAGNEEEIPDNFYENLAQYIDQKTLDTLAGEILEGIENDKDSRQDWSDSVEIIIQYLGWKIEEYENKLCSGYDNTLSITLINCFALLKSELLPPSGVAKGVVNGVPNEETVDTSERLAMFYNFFLTVIDKPYLTDKEKLILYVCLLGVAFTKVYIDPATNQPRARLVKPQDLIVNNECTSLLESSRITHEMELTKKEILFKEMEGVFLKGTIKNADNDDDDVSKVNEKINDMDGIVKNYEDNRAVFGWYESHVELSPSRLRGEKKEGGPDNDEDYDDIPRPYIVDICKNTKKIASIKRNWDRNDSKFKREECFTEWHFLTGLGMYGIGLGQLLGSNAVVLTNTLRQTLDSVTFGNFPGGFIRKGSCPDVNNLTVYPGTFTPIDTDDKPTSEVFSTLPFSGPTPIGLQIRSELKGDTAALGGAAQQASPVGDSEAPVGTTLANIEIRDRFPSNILQSFINSFSYEFELLGNAFKKTFDKPYVFDAPGKTYQVTAEDFQRNVKIVSVADPNLATKSQRIVINEILIRLARENPGTIDLKEAVRRLLKSMDVDDIEKLMPPPQEILPADPVTENMNLINGKGARASIEQDHDAHMISHSALLQIPAVAQDPQKVAQVQAHITEHQADKYLVDIQMAMGIQMPDPEALKDPQVQNQIALMAAQATQQMQQQQQAQNPPPPNPAVVMIEDIKQKREATLLKHEDAKLKAETEAFKAQTQFESDKLKMDVEKELAEEKNKTSLAIAKMKQ